MSTVGSFLLMALAILFIHQGNSKIPQPFRPPLNHLKSLAFSKFKAFPQWNQLNDLKMMEKSLAQEFHSQPKSLQPKFHHQSESLPLKFLHQSESLPLKKKASPSSPWFCHNIACPTFTKLPSKGPEYQVREYVATKWFSTSLKGIDLSKANKEMFHKLFDYIDGENVKKETIKMTAPVLVQLQPGEGPACKNNFTMSFFNAEPEKMAPKPTSQDVFFSDLPKQKVFVRSFGGYANESKWIACAEQLGKELLRDGEKYRKDFFFTAGYDSPFHVLHRHNEVWFIAED